MLDLCFSIHDRSGTYYKNTLISLFSVFDNTSEKVTAHIFCDETLTDNAKKSFDELANKFSQEIIYYAMQQVSEDILEKIPEKFGKGALYRLFIPELIKRKRVLHLDSDIICTLDIKEIFEESSPDCCLCGVVDAWQMRQSRVPPRMRKLGLSPERYINTGVLLMNLDNLRERHPAWRQELFALLPTRRWVLPNQDSVNSYFIPYPDDISFLPDKYNYSINVDNRHYLEASSYSGKILHFTKEKPWSVLSPAGLLYWQYYMRFFNDNNIFDILRGLGRPEDAVLFDFILGNEKVRRLAYKAYDVHTKGLLHTIRKKLQL